MSEAQAGAIEIEEIRLDWSEMAEIAENLFDVQDGGSGGFQWARLAWQLLSEVGLNRYVLEVERTVCILRFIALSAFYSEFCVRAFDEGAAGDWEYFGPAGLVGDYPFIDAFSLGQLAEQRGVLVDNDHRSRRGDALGIAITDLAKAEYRQVLNVLQALWGKKELFVALSASRGIELALDPLGDDTRNQVCGTGQTMDVWCAWDWYDAGANLDGCTPLPPRDNEKDLEDLN
jgi:hypothetical protein